MSRTRKVNLRFTPEVTSNSYAGTIKVKTGSYHGETKFECTGELSMNCAAELVVKLREAMRAIRAEHMATMDRAIAKAEKPL